MKTLNCVIVDDEDHVLDLLSSYVSQIPHLHLIGSYPNGRHLLENPDFDKIDLAFLDIHMPKISGLHLSHLLPKHAQVVFVSAYFQDHLGEYANRALDFLDKPTTFERFAEVVEKAQHHFQTLA
jgi:response regulator of citrate/malate metabolism